MTFTENVVAAIQSRLADLGYYKSRVDGLAGPGTSNAVIRFKESHGLRARDFIGPLTLTALFSENAKQWKPAPAVKDDPPWLTEARSLLGTREVPGRGNNPKIMQWAKDLDQWYPGDDVPWCGLFVAHCMAVGAPNEPQDFNRLGARNWLGYGEAADRYIPRSGLPSLGSVCVLWRTHPVRSWHGHVFIVTGQSGDAIRGIGGNQSDNVTEAWFDRGRVLGVRVPAGYEGKPAPSARTGQLSTNEA